MKTIGSKKSSFVTAAAIVLPFLVGAPMAHSADMLDQDNAFTEVEFGTGWYIRGDVAATFKEVESSLPTAAPEETLGTASSFGFGGGYIFGNGLRGEAQFSYLTGLEDASSQGVACLDFDRGDGLGPRPDRGSCRFRTRADLSVTSFMANAYLDGPTFWNITPYVGAGAGLSIVQWNDFQDFDLCIGRTSNEDCRGQGGGLHILRQGEAITETAITPTWNVMFGAAYQISKNLKLDVGYRYLRTGETSVATAADNTFFTTDIEAEGLAVHEVRVGLRYEIW